MPLYENSRNAENRILLKEDGKNAIVFGAERIVSRIVEAVSELRKAGNTRLTLAFEG
jgi:hypothetical protein